MDFNEYQKAAASTALYPSKFSVAGLVYCTLGLTGEAGEVANKVKKIIRTDKTMENARQEIADELGDALWYLAEAATNLGFTLEEIAEMNIAKLAARKLRGMVQGSGDNR